MSHATVPIDFRTNTQQVPPKMPAAVQKATARFLGGRATLVEILGKKIMRGLNSLTDGDLASPEVRKRALAQARARGFKGAGE